jgi:signal transduction histidine kinase
MLIRDNGEGIKPRDIKSVFSPFYSTKSNPQSFGLGLTYCYMVMQEHGGRIDVQSNEGVGTTVVLQFAKSKVHCG